MTSRIGEFIFCVRRIIKPKKRCLNSEVKTWFGKGISMISWLLAVAAPLVPSEALLEPGEMPELILWLIVAAISLVLVIIFSISYTRVKSTKLLITTFAFVLFFIKAIILAMKLFVPNYADEFWWAIAAVLDILIVGLIAISLSKKA